MVMYSLLLSDFEVSIFCDIHGGGFRKDLLIIEFRESKAVFHGWTIF